MSKEVKHILFKNEGPSVKCIYYTTLYIEKANVEILLSGNLSVMLFGSFCIVDYNGELVEHTITLGTRVTIPIYHSGQYREEESHYVIEFMPEDIIIQNRTVPASIDNVSDMFNTITSGHLSPYVDYDKYYDIIINNIKTNEKMGFPLLLLEIMLGEIFVDEHGVKCRISGTKRGTPLSINDLIQTAGTFNSMLHEDADKSILINKGKTREQQQQISKLETYFRK